MVHTPATARSIDNVTGACASPLTPKMTPDGALRAMVGNALDHLTPNAARVAAGTGVPAHLHQTRVALRRLRTALRILGDWSDAVDPAWSATLDDVFQRLSAARDQDALSEGLLPELLAAGAPAMELPLGVVATASPQQVLRSRACQRVLRDLRAFSEPLPRALVDEALAHHAPPASPTLKSRVRPLIKRMHHQMADDARCYASADDAARHHTRKRLKRLRYSVEFVAPLFASRAVSRYLAPLRQAQDALGAFNDMVVAEQAFRAQLAHDPRAWFALGWLAARRPTHLRDCADALAKLAQAERFWKG